MAFHLDLGRYYPADSFVHALDVRVKLCCIVALLVGIFCISNLPQLVLGAVVTAALPACARIPASRVLSSVRPLAMFLGVLSLFNLVFIQTGATLVELGSISITTGGVLAAVLYTLRFLLALVLGSLILLTSTPTQIADALDRLLSPLSRVGLPGHELAMVFSLMLRFVPTLSDEASAIMEAQSLRGGSFNEGSIAQRLRSLSSVVISLLASGLRHAEGLSRALDTRCYEGGSGRTHLHEQHLGAHELVAILATGAFLVALIALAYTS